METFAHLFKKGKIVTYKKNEIIFSPHIKPLGVYQLKSGYVYSYSLTKDNKKRIQSIIKPGDVFPLLQYVHTANVNFYIAALTDITVFILESEPFFSQVYADNNLLKELVKSLAKYLGGYVERVGNLEMETLQKRVIGRIIHFSTEYGIKKGNEVYIEVPLTHELIAQSINVSRSNVSRELEKLQEEGIIAFQKKHLIVVNFEELKKQLEEL